MEFFEPLIAVILLSFGKDSGKASSSAEILPALIGVAACLVVTWVTTRAAARAQLSTGAPFRLPASIIILQAGLFGMLVLGTSWVRIAVQGTGDLPLLSDLVAFLPYVGQRVLRAVAGHEVERRAYGRNWTLEQYVVFNLRVIALVVAPIFLIHGVVDGVAKVPALQAIVTTWVDLSLTIGLLVVVPLVFAASPLLVKWVLGARPLPRGALRTRLEAYSARIGFRPTDILVWDTGRTVTNALYLGIVRGFRYVVITDALIETLAAREIEGVFAHEAGHGMRRHTLLYLLMTLTVFLLSLGIVPEVVEWGRDAFESMQFKPVQVEWLTMGLVHVTSLSIFAAFLFMGLGWASRRFETEADVHAVKTLEDPADFTRALEAVGLHLGAMRKGGGFRHFGIGRRLGLVNRYLHEEDFRRGFDRLILSLKVVTVALLVAGLGWFAWRFPAEIEEGRIASSWALAQKTGTEPDIRAALRHLEESRETVRTRARRVKSEILGMLGDALLSSGDFEEARRIQKELERSITRGDVYAAFNSRNLAIELDAIEGKVDLRALRDVVMELDDLLADAGGAASGGESSYSDLYLAARAQGEKGLRIGDPAKYLPLARLRWLLDDQGSAPRKVEEAAAEEGKSNAYRRTLFERMR